MFRRSTAFAAYALIAAGAYFTSIGEATAAGCNGVVDQLKWGCAAWDNNNGPQYPHYKPPQKTGHSAAKPTAPAQPPKPVIAPNSGHGIVSRDGAGIISRDGAGLIGADGATLQRR